MSIIKQSIHKGGVWLLEVKRKVDRGGEAAIQVTEENSMMLSGKREKNGMNSRSLCFGF